MTPAQHAVIRLMDGKDAAAIRVEGRWCWQTDIRRDASLAERVLQHLQEQQCWEETQR
jgi:hypothetical protein